MRPFFAGILHTNSPKPTASNGPSQNFRVDGFTNFISNTCISPLFISRNVKAFAQKVHKGKVGDRLCPVCGRRWIVHRSSLGAGARRKVSAAQVPTPLCSTCGELHKQGGDQTVHIVKRSQKVQPIRNAQLHLHNQLFAKEAALQLPGNLD